LEVARETIGSVKSQKKENEMDYLTRLSQKSGKREKQKAKMRTDIKNHFQHCYSYTSNYLRYLQRKQTATVVLQILLFTKGTNGCENTSKEPLSVKIAPKTVTCSPDEETDWQTDRYVNFKKFTQKRVFHACADA